MEWSEPKQRVLRFEKNIVVSAGAGSGKTRTLVELYLRLLAGETAFPRPLSPEEIIAITFTDKAAVEMKERIRAALAEKVAHGEGGADWQKLLRGLTAAHIATFHALCARILRENPVEAEVDPQFRLLDELESSAELEGAVQEVIEGELAAQSAEIRLLLVQFPLAGRGEGKGVRDYLISLHWQRGSSGLSEEAVRERIDATSTEAESLFAATAKELSALMEEVERIIRQPRPKPLKFIEQLRPLPALHASATLDPRNDGTLAELSAMGTCIAGNWGNERPVKERLLESLETLELCWGQMKTAPLAQALVTLAGKLEAAYTARKELKGGLDFEDLLLKVRDLLRDDARLRDEYRERFPVVMVDEFQDTNPLQKELVSLLCGPEQRLFMVGDPKQSIYLFRGADVAVFGEAQAEVLEAGGENLYFQESFRSRQGIVDFVNALFSRVMQGGSGPFAVEYREGDHLQPVRTDWDNTPCVELLTMAGDGTSQELRTEEAAAIAARISWLVAGQSEVSVFDRHLETGNPQPETVFLPRPARYGDIAVLFRRFTNLKLYEQALRDAGIPYYVVKGKGFYRCQEVLDLINLLRHLDFAGDLPALAGVLRSPLCGVSDETLYLLSRLDGGVAAWEKIFAGPRSPVPGPCILDRILTDDRQRLARLAQLLARLRPLRDRLTLPELLEEAVTATDFVSSLLATFQGGQKAANVRKLIELSRSFGGRGEGTLRSFVTYLNGLVEREPTEAEAVVAAPGENVVRLMTVHQSKGLEFPIVFVPECGAPSPPDPAPVKFDPALGLGVKYQPPAAEGVPSLAFRRIADLRREKEEAELKRLFYVAVTRARDHLYLSGEGKGAWRAWLDSFTAEDRGSLLKVSVASATGEYGAAPVEPAATPVAPEMVARASERAIAWTTPLPRAMHFSPTALEDYRSCPRKYFYKGVLGLDEGLFADLLATHGSRKPRQGMSALEKGDLAHRILERLDFAAGTAEQQEECMRLAAVAAAVPGGTEVGEVIEQVMAFAASPVGRQLAGKRLYREHPFVLGLNGRATYQIRGTMDLVAIDNGRVTVYDYKYATRQGADLAGYHFQLCCYQLALAKAFPAHSVAGQLLFLKDGSVEPVTCDLAPFERELLAIMDDIVTRREEGDFATMAGCDASHCPFARKCGVTGR